MTTLYGLVAHNRRGKRATSLRASLNVLPARSRRRDDSGIFAYQLAEAPVFAIIYAGR